MTKLLIVDDNEQDLYMLQVLLRGHGYEVVSATNGTEALEMARRDPPDMVISDILMPVMDGFALCRHCKEDEQLKEIPFVFYTATYTDPRDEEFGLSLGAERFLVKPIEPEEFVEILQEVIEEDQAGRRIASREPIVEETVYFKKYNELLVRKLEDKMLQLEETNRALERDIKERKRVEEVLRESEKHYRLLIAQMLNGLALHEIICDETGRPCDYRFLEVNPAFEAMTGLNATEIVGKTVLQVLPQTEPYWIETYGQVALSGNSIRFENYSRELDKHFEVLAYSPKKGQFATVFTDVTERKQAEEALRESEEKHRTLFETMAQGVVYQDASGKIISANPAAERLLGLTLAQMQGRTSIDPRWKAIHADGSDFPGETHPAMVALKTGTPVKDVVMGVFNPQEEQYRWIIVNAVPQFKAGENRPSRVYATFSDITERKRAEETLRQRNRELELLNQAGRAFNSTLELDDVLITVLEETRQMLEVVACSVWLIDPEADELVCRQSAGSGSEIVRHWRLAYGQGIAGWVARHEESLIIPDAQADQRSFEGVGEQTGLKLRSILAVPLRVRGSVIGVLEVVDNKVDRFTATDLTLVELLASAAAPAIDNARLYEQAWQDAETKSVLLREVNHRVKNNLSAILGLLSIERRHAAQEQSLTFQALVNDLTNRIKGLDQVHSLLSATQWQPLLLSDLAQQMIRTALTSLPSGKSVAVTVTPSPVRVAPDQAHNLALIINELATNTVKHALPERATAQITVRITLDGDTVQCEFRDDGPGYAPDVLELGRQNVGMYLVQTLAHKGLRGELDLGNDRGAVTIIRFKAME